MNLLVHFVINGHSWCFKSSQIALAYGSCNFENFQNITRAHKSRNALAFIRFPILIPLDTRVTMYNALIMPYFNYCGAVWGNVNKGLADKLQKLQNRAARILTFSSYDVRSSVLLDELGWERLEYVRLKQLAVTMYKIHNDLSPSYLRRIFTNTSNVQVSSFKFQVY